MNGWWKQKCDWDTDRDCFCFSISSIATSLPTIDNLSQTIQTEFSEWNAQPTAPEHTPTSLIRAQIELIGNEKWVHAVNAIILLSEMVNRGTPAPCEREDVCVHVCMHVCQMQRRNWGSSSIRIYLLVSFRGTCFRFDFFLFHYYIDKCFHRVAFWMQHTQSQLPFEIAALVRRWKALLPFDNWQMHQQRQPHVTARTLNFWLEFNSSVPERQSICLISCTTPFCLRFAIPKDPMPHTPATHIDLIKLQFNYFCLGSLYSIVHRASVWCVCVWYAFKNSSIDKGRCVSYRLAGLCAN